MKNPETCKSEGFYVNRILLVFLLFIPQVIVATVQPVTVRGTVTDASNGEPLIGVNILIQGTQQGTTTDGSGNYTLQVPSGDAVLVVSYVGYSSRTIPVGGQSTINIALEGEVSELQEIVVIGYGTMRRNEVTSAVTNVKSDEFNKGNVNNPVQLIQGKVSGLSISKPGGNPNAGFDIRLRGLNTVGSNTGPLVVIDGLIGGSLTNVDPNDVESISVLKDASAAAIYGTRGSNGVILVTTKRGRAGSTQLEYNGYVTVEMVAKNTPVMTASEWRSLSDELGVGTDYGASTDWFDEIEQTGLSHVHNLSLSGGTEQTNFRASINYREANGIMITTGNNQLNGRLNLSQKALNDRLSIEFNLGATEKNSDFGFDAAFRYASIYNPTSPVYADPSDPDYERYQGYYQNELFDYYNPVSILKLNSNKGRDRLLTLSGRASLEIVKGLRAEAFYSLQTNSSVTNVYYDQNDYWGGLNRDGLASNAENASNNKLFETTVHFNGNLFSDLNLNLLGGYSYQYFNNEGFYTQAGGVLTDKFKYYNIGVPTTDLKYGLATATSYRNSNKLIAFFGRANFNYKEMLFLMVSARYEGSSKFGSNEKWGLFPGISAGFEISRFLNAAAIDNLKLRVNYGVTGNTPQESYLSLERYGALTQYFPNNGKYRPAYGVISNPNPDLKWERQSEFDAGFDFSLFGARLFGSFDYYTRKTTDLLFNFNVPNPPNIYPTAWVNIGEIKSSGLELSLSFKAVQSGDFNYTFSLSPSYNIDNTLVSLSGTYNNFELEYGVKDLGDMGSPGQNQTPLTRVREGGPIGELLALEYKEIDEDGNLVFVDQPGTSPGIDQADRVIVGNGLPKFLIGFGNDFTYKNWDLNIFFRGVFGHDLLNSFRGFYEVPQLITSYNLPKTAKDQKNGSSGTYLNTTSGKLSSYHIENADFIALDNASLGYNFNVPQKWHVQRIRLYVAGNNLFYITGYKGVDPTPRYVDSDPTLGTFNNPLVPGVDRRDTWFRTRSVSFGANIIF